MPKAKLPPDASFHAFQEFDIKRLEQAETNDCAVRAVSAATKIPYEEVLLCFKLCGRRSRKSTQTNITWAVLQQFGYSYTAVCLSDFNPPSRAARGKHGITSHHPDRFPHMWKGKGTFLCFSQGHVWAVVDGTVIDWSRGKSLRVRHIARIEKL
jgi:hypothetical protein